MTNSEVSQNYEENVAKGKTVKTFCNRCEKEINHEVVMDYFNDGSEAIPTGCLDAKTLMPEYVNIEWKDDYQIIKCAGCDSISFRKHGWFSEYADMINNGTYEELYPKCEKRKLKDFQNMPDNLRAIYKETIATYNSQGFILCAGGIRAILEGICKNKNINKDALVTKINKMCSSGIITQSQKDSLDKLRSLGNESLHKLVAPKTDEIEAALDIVEHIVSDLYEISAKAAVLKSSKKNSKDNCEQEVHSVQ